MAKSSGHDRFAPPLMQAFRDAARERDSRKVADERDANGERVIAGRRNTARRATNEQTLRRELSIDLATLLNTINLGSTIDISGMPHVASSILNFGLADISTLSVDEMAVADVAGELGEILRSYEPRLVPESIVVEREAGGDATDMKVRFLIRAEMRANPIDLPIEFAADLEIETAKMQISRL